MKGQCIAAFGCPRPRRSLAPEGNLLAAEARLVTNYCAGAALALQAVAHRDARWFAFNHQMKLATVAGGMSGGHGSRLWLSIWVECRPDYKTMHPSKGARILIVKFVAGDIIHRKPTTISSDCSARPNKCRS